MQHHHVVSTDGQQSLTIFPSEGTPIIVTGDHPQFDKILRGARWDQDVEELRALADATSAVVQYMQPLSERVTVKAGRVYFDGDELDTSLTQQIIRVLEDEGDSGTKLGALVAFLEKLYTNPSESARAKLYDWLRSRPFGITYDGDLIGYKGVNCTGEYDEDAAEFTSCTNGPATVDGTEYAPDTGCGVPQSVGSTVEMPRSVVDPAEGVECSSGLHVGTWSFASSYGDTMLKVLVNPRDVVGVPSGVAGSEKFRCCRYVIYDVAEEEAEGAVVGLS